MSVIIVISFNVNSFNKFLLQIVLILCYHCTKEVMRIL